MSGWWLTVKLAFRSLGRNRKRSAITLIAVSLAVIFVLLSLGMMSGIERQSANNLINLDYGHLKILPESFDITAPAYDSLFVLADIPEIIFQNEDIKAYTARLKFPAIVSDGLDQFPCLGYGIDIINDPAVFELMNIPLNGRFWELEERGIVVGENIARTFGLKPITDELTLVGRSTLGAIDAVDLPILGIITTGYPVIDQNGVLVPIAVAQNLLNSPGEVSEISFRLKDPNTLQKTTSILRQELSGQNPPVRLFTWRDLAQDFLAIHRLKTRGMGVTVFFFILIAALGVANAILIAAFERTREVGMMRALGMKSGEIMRQFIYEGAVLGLAGAFIGGIIGTAFNLYLQEHGINLTAMYGDLDLGYPIKDYLYAHFRLLHLIATVIIATLLSALAAYLPARRTSRLSPSDALRSH